MVAGLKTADRVDVVERLPARVLRIAQHRAGGADARGHFVYAETRQVAHAEVLGQESFGEIDIEIEGGTTRDLSARADVDIFRHHQFGCADSVQLRDQLAGRIAFADVELSRRNVEPAQSPAIAVGMRARQHALAVRIQQPVFGQRPRGHDARHAALDRSLRRGRVADLFADRDGSSHAREARQVAVHAVVGHARHGDGTSPRASSGGEGNVEQVRRLAGVVEEQLVEVAHAVEQQDVREFGLDTEVLLHHRGMGHGVHFPRSARRPYADSACGIRLNCNGFPRSRKKAGQRRAYCKPGPKMSWDMTLSAIFLRAGGCTSYWSDIQYRHILISAEILKHGGNRKRPRLEGGADAD